MSLRPVSSSNVNLAPRGVTTPSSSKRGYRRWARRIFISILALFVVLIVGTLILGARAKAALIAQYPAPGQMVDVGGYRLHINCTGRGSPTVIMEAGLSEPSLMW